MLVGCAGPYVRAAPVLGTFHGVSYSNSIVWIEEREPSLDADTLRLAYAVVLDNRGLYQAQVELGTARARVDGVRDGVTTRCVECPSGNHKPHATLPPGHSMRVECRIELSAEATRQVALGDRDLSLILPVSAAEETLDLTFEYLLLVGDAE